MSRPIIRKLREEYPETGQDVAHQDGAEDKEEHALEAMAQLKDLLSYGQQFALLFQNLEHSEQTSQLHQLVEAPQLGDSYHTVDIRTTILI